MLRIAEHFQDSDVGRQRERNEDSMYVRVPLFAIADGMGGAQAGEVASGLAVRSFEAGLPDGVPPTAALAGLIEQANAEIFARAQEDPELAGMGTTVTAAYLAESELAIAHVGDSRCYLLRDDELVRLTRDHSLVGELVARGKLTEEQAELHPQRSVITRALGAYDAVEVDTEIVAARAGDVFLLCSDGLTGMVPELELAALLGDRERSLEQIGRALIAAANEAGGRDNITVILFRLVDVDDARGAQRAQPAATVEQPAVRPPRRRTERKKALVLVMLALVLPLLIGGWMASRAVFFVGTEPGPGRPVAIYRGLPYELPFGVSLYERFYVSGVPLSAVPRARRARVTDHSLRSRDDAETFVIALEKGEVE